MKITMVGTSGCGKTTFSAGVYQRLMAQSIEGFRIVPRAEDLSQEMLQTHKFAHDFKLLANRTWPPGVDRCKRAVI